MIRAVRVELTRWRWRPIVGALVVAAVLFAVAAAGLTAWQSRPLSEAELSDATAQAELFARDAGVQAEVEACEQSPEIYLGEGASRADCVRTLARAPQSFAERDPLQLAEVVPLRGVQVTIVVVCLMVLAGASFAGGDWATGSLRTQLQADPRRLRLWTAKALAVLLGAAATTAVALLGFWGVLGAVGQLRGIDVSGEVVLDAVLQALRGVALGGCAALGAYALTMLFRDTVATLALLFVYAVGGEIALGLLLPDQLDRWSVGANTVAWLRAGYAADAVPYLWPAAFLGALTLVAAVLSVPVFRRRDV